MRISVTEPIERAWNRMVLTLFKPFDIGKWFTLGFCFFLANLGRGGGGGGNGNFNIPSGGGGPQPQPIPPTQPQPIPPGGTPTFTPPGQSPSIPTPSGTPTFPQPGTTPAGPGQTLPGMQTQTASDINAIIQWIKTNLSLVLLIVIGALLLFTLIWALILWLRSRGVFMMIDGLVRNRGAVREPWRVYREHGNSMFKFSMIMWIIGTAITLLTLAVAGYVAWPDILSETFGVRAIWAIIILVVILPLTWINYAIIEMLLIDFVGPTMYLYDLPVGAAWKHWYREAFKGHFWVITLFYLMKFVLNIGVGIAAMIAMCLTCCLVTLPYIGTVILLPAFVFTRLYTLYFLEQFGEPWRLFISEGDELLCVSCGYDLRGNPDAPTCPECGGVTPAGMPPQPQTDTPPATPNGEGPSVQ